MTGPFEPCWTSENADRVLETEALAGSDAVFLATHTPIEGFKVEGSQAAQLNRQTEAELLRVLSLTERRHAFCVVHGEPGSGKSHFIKWLHIKWPKVRKDVVLLIRRADGSLEGTLGQLERELGAEFSDLFKDLRQTTKVSDAGRALGFTSRLSDALHPDFFEDALPDTDWCREYQPASIISLPAIKEKWQSPKRVLTLIEGGGQVERNSESAVFNLYDIHDLVIAGQGAVINSGVKGGAERLWKKLQTETQAMREFMNEEWLVADVEVHHADRFPQSMNLVNALNRRRNQAVQGVMGISPAGLKKLFQKVRQRLNQGQRRLILLLEDITSFQGVDDSLIDVLVDDKGTQDSGDDNAICPIISVVGVTPKYYGDLQGNYRQRVTHEIFLGDDTGGLQDVALLRDSSKRQGFVVRYMSAVRSGQGPLLDWMTAEEPMGLPPPNACTECSIRSKCFATFGEVDGIGTFPFTPAAIDRFFQALKLDDKGQTWRTPRGVIQAILGPSLRNTQSFETTGYPGQNILATSGISDDAMPKRVISVGLQRRILSKLPDAPETQQRIGRVISFWGSPKSEETLEDGGELAFAGVRRSIFDAFDLPWIGEDISAKPFEDDHEPVSVVDDTPAIEPRPTPTDLPTVTARPATRVTDRRTSTPVPATPSRPTRKTSRSDLEKLQDDLKSWGGGERPNEGQRWNTFLFEIISTFDLRRYGISPAMLHEFINANRVKIAGSSSGSREDLEIDRAEWVLLGLESYLTHRLGQFEPNKDRERGIRRLTHFTRKLEERVVAFIEHKLPLHADGGHWQPVASMAQILLARSIIRGDLEEGASLEDCLKVVLSDAPAARGDRQVRSLQWTEFLEATDHAEGALRKKLRLLLNLEGDAFDKLSGMIDASTILPAIEQMRIDCKLSKTPSDPCPMAKDLDKARALVSDWEPKWLTMFVNEQRQVEGRAREVNDFIEDDAILEHCRRIDHLIEQASLLLPNVQPEQVSAWKLAQDKIASRIDPGSEKSVIGLLDAFEGKEWSGPVERIDRYCRTAHVPVAELELIRQALKTAHALIGEYVKHAEDKISASKDIPDAGLLKVAGKKFAEVSRAFNQFEAMSE